MSIKRREPTIATYPLQDRLRDLSFLVEFAEMSVEKLRGKEVEIASRLNDIIARRTSGIPARPPIRFDASGRHTTSRGVVFQLVGRRGSGLPKLQARLARLLRAIVTDNDAATTRRAAVEAAARDVHATPFFQIALGALDDGGGLRLCATVDRDGDDLLYATWLLLDEVGRERLVLCKAADCEHLVLRQKKRLYCSDTCYMRGYMREYRDNDNMPPPKRGNRKGGSRGKPTRAWGR